MAISQENRKAFGYLRVSGLGQVDGDGFRRQEEEIKTYCQNSNIELVNCYREKGVSGTIEMGEREAFQEMLTAILKNGVRTIIIESLDRLAREFRIQESIVIYLASKGITLISARTEQDITAEFTSDPMRKALIQIQGVFSELDKAQLVKKLRTAREEKRKSGKCEGRKSYSEAKPELVVRIKQLHRKPRAGKRATFQSIADTLNLERFMTLSDKEFTKFTVQNIVKSLK